MEKVRLGVIGAASMIAREYHLPALSKCEGVEFEMACDLNLERLKEVKEQYGFNKVTDNYKDVLADPDVDAVVILTKIDTHAEISMAAAKAKKQIFMQKAISYSLEEAQRIIDTVKESGVQMTISYMHRYFDECRKAAEIIQSGELGEIQYVRMRNSTKNAENIAASYGGCIMDIGGHGIDLIRSLFHKDIVKVKTLYSEEKSINTGGWSANLNGDETVALLMYELEGGAQVIHEILWSHVSKTDRFEVEVTGRKGSLYIRNPFMEEKLCLGIAEQGVEHGITWSSPETEHTFFGQRHHQLFVDDVRFGTHYSLTAEDGFDVLGVVEAARRSMESGDWETPVKYKNREETV